MHARDSRALRLALGLAASGALACGGVAGSHVTTPAPERPLGAEGPLRVRLPDGPTVILAPMPSSPAVSVQAWVRAGAADEGPGEQGAAHLLEHMLFRGGGRVDLARAVEQAGGHVNAFTTHDHTVVY